MWNGQRNYIRDHSCDFSFPASRSSMCLEIRMHVLGYHRPFMKPLSWSRIATESEPSEWTTIMYLRWKEGSKFCELYHRIHVAGKGYFLLEAILIGIYMWNLICKMCTTAIRFDVRITQQITTMQISKTLYWRYSAISSSLCFHCLLRGLPCAWQCRLNFRVLRYRGS